MIDANNPKLSSWLKVPSGHDFQIQNLPFGIFSTSELSPRPGVALGNYVIHLSALYSSGYLSNLPYEESDFSSDTLNPIINKGKSPSRLLRARISELFRSDASELRDSVSDHSGCIIDMESITMHMPVHVGDYTD